MFSPVKGAHWHGTLSQLEGSIENLICRREICKSRWLTLSDDGKTLARKRTLKNSPARWVRNYESKILLSKVKGLFKK